jgi:nitrite reductase/ring-hydroxylating ferredoxin subunit
MSYRRVAEEREVPERGGLRVDIEGRSIGIFRVDGSYYAMDDVCPHAGFPLSEGELCGHTVLCPLHGWEFDLRSGIGPQQPYAPPLACYKVKVEDGAIWIDA